MKLPNAENAVVDIKKLRDYCLSSEHRRGKHKAQVFAAVFQLTAQDSEELQKTLLSAARTEDAVPTEEDEYGRRYILDFLLRRENRQAMVRSCWIIRRGETFPRLTSCYIL